MGRIRAECSIWHHCRTTVVDWVWRIWERPILMKFFFKSEFLKVLNLLKGKKTPMTCQTFWHWGDSMEKAPNSFLTGIRISRARTWPRIRTDHSAHWVSLCLLQRSWPFQTCLLFLLWWLSGNNRGILFLNEQFYSTFTLLLKGDLRAQRNTRLCFVTLPPDSSFVADFHREYITSQPPHKQYPPPPVCSVWYQLIFQKA